MKPNHLPAFAASLFVAAAPLSAETPAETLERGIFLQETRNDPAAALAIYQDVVAQDSRSREIVSEAWYRLGVCHLMLGEQAEGRAALEALAADAAADRRWAGKAAAALAETRFIRPAPWPDGEIATYRLLGPANQDMGFMISAVETGDDGMWTSYFIRGASQWGASKVSFDKDSYDPAEARFFMDGFGDFVSTYSGDGAVTVKSGGEVVWSRDADASTLPLFDNDQVIQLLRVLPQATGAKVVSEVAVPFNNVPIPFTMEVAAEETVQTDAGAFECVKIVTNIGQDFWISTADDRRLIKMKIGPASVEALKFSAWDSSQPTRHVSRKHGATLIFPPGVLWGPPDEKDKGLRVHVYPTDFSAFGGIVDIRTTAEIPAPASHSSAAWAKADLAEGKKMFEAFETVHQADAEIGGLATRISRTVERRGEVTSQTYHIHALGPEKSVSMRLSYPAGGEDAVAELAARLLEGVSFNRSARQ